MGFSVLGREAAQLAQLALVSQKWGGPSQTAATDFLLQTPVVWDLECTDYPAGNPEYVQTTPAGHIPFGFEAWSLTNCGKALGVVWKFAHGRSLGTSLGQIFPDNSCGFSTVCPIWCKAAVQVFQLVENPAEMATLQTYQALLVNRRQVGERGMDRMFLLKNVSPSIQCHPTPSYSETSQPGILAGSILLLPFTKVKGHRENLWKDIGLRIGNFGSKMVENCCVESLLWVFATQHWWV